ncbi:MAG: hypothetical protein ACLFTT_11765 [Candidatus Hydrogenedentota bacterium]
MLVWLAIIAAAGATGLVANPGFEQLVADQPARWDQYVFPQEGAFARLDDRAHEGRYCAMIHMPLAHPEQPVNNWSQNLYGDFGGKSFRAHGYIRTENARDAAIWVQCWRKRPLRLLDTATTTEASPVYGTMDWRETAVTFEAPKGTSFMTVRCVLRGHGTAWFDAVDVTPVNDKAEAEAEAEAESPEIDDNDEGTPDTPPDAAKGRDWAARANRLLAPSPMPEPHEDTSAKAQHTAAPASPAAEPARPSEAKPDASTLRRENRRLRSRLDVLEQSNDALREEVLRMREELAALNRLMTTPDPEPTPVPPLVPAGVDWKGLL